MTHRTVNMPALKHTASLLSPARIGFKSIIVSAALVAVGSLLAADQCLAASIIGDPVPLGELVAGGELTVGDKHFSEFGYAATGDMPESGDVNVIPIQDDDGNYGIRFQGAFVDIPSSPNGSDALITYSVAVLDDLKLISDAHIQGNPALLGEFGSISVTETFLPLGVNGEYTMKIFDDESLPNPVLADWVFFADPVKSLKVQKDILAIAANGSQTATLSFVDQTFSQVAIPEPSTAILLVGCCLGLFGYSRSRKHA